jgi:hypothetical protein
MSDLGQVQTNVMGRKLVRFREISRRPTSAFTSRPNSPLIYFRILGQSRRSRGWWFSSEFSQEATFVHRLNCMDSLVSGR